MSSRDEILNNIKKSNKTPKIPLPSIRDIGIKYDNKFEEFKSVIQSVGGDAFILEREELDSKIKELYPNVSQISSNVEGVTIANFDPDSQDDPHALAKIDLAIVKGEIAVAENGSVWVKNLTNRHRVLYFIAQNLIIVVDKNSIVNNMHEAYDEIDFNDSGYGTFISGPSKTADIEQSLVIGAHGPKSGYVFFV